MTGADRQSVLQVRTRNGRRVWMEGLGEHVRRTRESLGLTGHPSVLAEAEAAGPGLGTDEEWLRYVAAYRGAPPAVRLHLGIVVEAMASAAPAHCS